MSLVAGMDAATSGMAANRQRFERAARDVVASGVPRTVPGGLSILATLGEDLVQTATSDVIGSGDLIGGMADMIASKRGFEANVSSFLVLREMSRESTRL